jgi:hypothetical protein
MMKRPAVAQVSHPGAYTTEAAALEWRTRCWLRQARDRLRIPQSGLLACSPLPSIHQRGGRAQVAKRWVLVQRTGQRQAIISAQWLPATLQTIAQHTVQRRAGLTSELRLWTSCGQGRDKRRTLHLCLLVGLQVAS